MIISQMLGHMILPVEAMDANTSATSTRTIVLLFCWNWSVLLHVALEVEGSGADVLTSWV